jgi:hypothetical protein
MDHPQYSLCKALVAISVIGLLCSLFSLNGAATAVIVYAIACTLLVIATFPTRYFYRSVAAILAILCISFCVDLWSGTAVSDGQIPATITIRLQATDLDQLAGSISLVDIDQEFATPHHKLVTKQAYSGQREVILTTTCPCAARDSMFTKTERLVIPPNWNLQLESDDRTQVIPLKSCITTASIQPDHASIHGYIDVDRIR